MRSISLGLAGLLWPVAQPLALELPDTADLGEMVVTAPTMSDPLTVETDTRAPRQPVPAADGGDFLKNIPGFSLIRKGGTSGDPLFRGLGGSRLNILQDGAQVLGGCGQRMDPPTAYIYPEAFESAKVIKGPQTVLYGPGNIAGAVLFERETERFEEPGYRGLASVLFGSHGRNDQVVDAAAGSQGGYVRLIGTRSEADNYKDGDGTEVHSQYYRWSGTAIAGWTPGRDTRVEVSADRSDGEAAYADRGMDGVVFDRTGYGIKLERENLSPLIGKVGLQYYHNYVDHVMDNFTLRTPSGMKMVSNPDRETNGARMFADLDLGGMFLTLGADYRRDEHTLRKASAMANAADPDVGSAARTADLSFRSTGLFAEAEREFGTRDNLVLGLRVDKTRAEVEELTVGGAAPGSGDEDTTRGGFVRWEHALAGLPAQTYVGVGRAERSPDYWERNRVFGLAPEKNTQLDVGLSYRTERLAANLATFYSQIEDYILITPAEAPTARNIDALSYGFEADTTYTWSPHWKSTATLAYVWGENSSDHRPLPQVAPMETTFSVDYDDRTYSAGALVRAVASQDRVDEGRGNIIGTDVGPTPGFAVLSLHAGYRASRQVKFTAGVDNLLDKTYAEHVSRAGADVAGFEQTTRVNEPGRTYWVKASARF